MNDAGAAAGVAGEDGGPPDPVRALVSDLRRRAQERRRHAAWMLRIIGVLGLVGAAFIAATTLGWLGVEPKPDAETQAQIELLQTELTARGARNAALDAVRGNLRNRVVPILRCCVFERLEGRLRFALYALATDGVALVAAGEAGVILRSSDQGLTWTRIDNGRAAALHALAPSPDGTALIAAGDAGVILRSSDQGVNWTQIDTVSQENLAALSLSPDGSALIAAGADGRFLRSDERGLEWTSIARVTEQDILALATSPDGTALIAAGAGGVVLRSVDQGENWGSVDSGTQVRLGALASSPDRTALIATGEGGVVLRSDSQGLNWTRIDSGSFQELYALAPFPGGTALIAAGAGGVILRSGDQGLNWTRLDSGTTAALIALAPSPDGTALIAAGEGGVILRSRAALADEVAALALPPGAAGDTVLRARLDDLPDNFRAPLSDEFRRDVADPRAALAVEIAGLESRIARLERNTLTLGQELSLMESFLATCTGAAEGPRTDALVTACAGAYTVALNEPAAIWWRFAIERVTPALLLVFLLAVLNASHRHASRLASFLDARADALEAASLDAPASMVIRAERIALLADAFAADKVGFGTAKSPGEQAVDLAKELLARSPGARP